MDSGGNAYVAYYTGSLLFPVTAGAFQTQNNADVGTNSGDPNAFVTKLNSTGTDLVYSTYLGGSGSTFPAHFLGDRATGLAIDNAGDAFVTGFTYSSDFPVTSGAFQTVNHSAANADASGFVTELNPTGSAEIYSTYLGGSGSLKATVPPQANGERDRGGHGGLRLCCRILAIQPTSQGRWRARYCL